MLPRTNANGASAHEAEAAAKHIGRLVMKFPGLLIGSQRTEPVRHKWPTPPPKPPADAVVFPHSGVIGESEKFILVVILGQKHWLPKATIQYSHNTVTIERQLAREKGLV